MFFAYYNFIVPVTINIVLFGATSKTQELTIFETLHFIFNSS